MALKQATLTTKVNRKLPNSMSINYSARVSNLEYVFFNLLCQLIYNDCIFAHFFYCCSASESPHMQFKTFWWLYNIFFIIFVVMERKKCCKISGHFCNLALYYYYMFNNVIQIMAENKLLENIKRERAY